ncbi:MAG TPA: NYN domain-containing protein, partial [Candidatus Pacearchaeota archaeon]|nr:NYN domain-containing protein [Candidatus Pacearchaeota archaeon]
MTTKKAIVFVDANNWYHNLKYSVKPSNVDICKLGEFLSEKYDFDVLEIRWYASVPDIEDNKLKYLMHMKFLGHLKKCRVKVVTRKLQKLSGKELKRKRREMVESWDLCEVCTPIVNEAFLDIADNQKKEKGIDVWVAVDMVKAAIDGVDVCVLVSGDADFVPAFNLIKEIGK